MRLTDVLLFDDQECLVVGDRKAGAPGHHGRRTGNRLGSPVAVGVPIRGLERSLFRAGHQIPTLGLQLCDEGVVDRCVDEDVAVRRTP